MFHSERNVLGIQMMAATTRDLLCTLGPTSMNDRVISRLDDVGITLFRINLSHTKLTDLADTISFVQRNTSTPVCLDTEGAQIRTGDLVNKEVNLRVQNVIKFPHASIIGDGNAFNLYPPNVIDKLEIGDILSIDNKCALVQVTNVDVQGLTARVLVGGFVGQNRAVIAERDIPLPVLTDKDRTALAVATESGIEDFALSFAHQASDVDEVRAIVGKDAHVISKIECIAGILQFDEIAAKSDALLLDRGDLSLQVPIAQIPRVQKELIKRANRMDVKMYVATNLLESMITSPVPTRAEVNDVFNTLEDGADGLVLAAETAIGSYPVRCAVMASRIIDEHSSVFCTGSTEEGVIGQHSLMLVEPHGKKLVNRTRYGLDPDTMDMKTLRVDQSVMSSAQQIALGAFSPLDGFMSKEAVDTVLNDFRLPTGVVWPLPIILQTDSERAQELRIGDTVGLVLEGTDEIYALLYLEDVYRYDLDDMAVKTYSTNDSAHPGVQMLKSRGEYFLAGKIDLIKPLPSRHRHYEITPRQARMIFENKGWSKVAGFHTRNVIHRVHEHMQLAALNEHRCDGVFVHPVIGHKKKGDYTADLILKSYELMIDKVYPSDKVFLGAFSNYSRYSGPREAVFTALCRKNFGCSHFIVGRDHTGVGRYYRAKESQNLFELLGDELGITPILFDEVQYCRQCDGYVEKCEHDTSSILSISGTEGRRIFQSGMTPPDWFMRSEIADMVLNELENGSGVFV